MFLTGSLHVAVACIGLLSGSNVFAATATQRVRQARTVVLLDFSSSVPEHFWEALKTELDRSEIAQLSGSEIVWMKREQFRKGMDFPEILQVSVQGNCTSMEQTPDSAPGPLGWVNVVSERIQPFAFVNCNRVRYVLGPAMRYQPRREQQDKMARAIARIMAHELTHILTQNRRHTSSGLQKAYLTQAELLRDGVP